MKNRPVVFIVGAVMALVIGYVALIRPVGAKIKEVRTDIATATAEENDLRLQLRQLQQAQQNAPEIAARLAKFDLLLPRSADLPNFIRQIQEAADQSGIELSSIAPSPPNPIAAGPGVDPALAGRGVFQINVVLNVQGGYFRLRSFLGRLESLQRVLQVNNLSVTPGVTAEGLATLVGTITMQMYLVNPAQTVSGVPSGGSPSPSPSPTGGSGGGPATPTPTSR